ncbi:MAG: hypothetical protein KBS81_11010 [Spirochaetales bacterium]|nr:hypothetical protein [Candidatus Physcosoma equi]
MKNDPLELQEDRQFTTRVVAYNNEEDQEKKERLYKGIKERTTLLIYLIAKRMLLLSPDEATSVLLECEKEIDRIIGSFKVAKCSYNQYLFQICRYRGRRILKKETARSITEANLMREDSVPFYIEERYNEEVYELPILPSVPNDDVLAMTMKELFSYIIKTKDRMDYPVFTKQENSLRISLKENYNRKCFLALLLTIPDRGKDDVPIDFARVFQTDEEAFECFFQRRRELQQDRKTAFPEKQRIANKHWRILTNLKVSIEQEYRKDAIDLLKDNYRSQANIHRKRVYEMTKCKRGLTHEEIGIILGYSRPTISKYVSDAKKMLLGVAELASVSTEDFEVSSIDGVAKKNGQ